MFVGSWGNWSDPNVAGSQDFPTSINVYPLDADGDTAPIRIIQGPKIAPRLARIVLDPDTGNLCGQRRGQCSGLQCTDDGT